MSNKIDNLSQKWTALSGQKKILYSSVGFMVLLFIFWNAIFPKKDVQRTEKISGPAFTTAVDTLDMSDIWLYRSEDRLQAQEKSLETMQKEIESLKGHDPMKSELAGHWELMQKRIDILEDELNRANEASVNTQASTGPHLAPLPGFAGDDQYLYSGENFNVEPGILNLRMDLKNDTADPSIKTVDNYIPVGSFASAVILSGVDAAASTNAQRDPSPVLLRVVGNAILPRQWRGKIKTCHVMAAGYGDISSERVMMRLETIACTDTEGRIFESPIEGYVSGEDGKAGVRGHAVWREGALLARSFTAGFLGGIGQGIADTSGSTSTSALGTVTTYNTDEILRLGFGSGASSSLDRLSQYYIDRAEQYHPIIEVAAGRRVELVINGSQGLSLKPIQEL